MAGIFAGMTPDIDTAQVRRHFSGHAGEYDLYAIVQKRVAATLLDRLPADVSGPAVDLGTGTGDVAAQLYQRLPGAQLIVSDLAHDMTEAALRRLPQTLGVDADARSLPFADASLGLVLSASMYQWIDDLPAAFAECRRVLRPGGYFCFALFGDGTLGELRSVFHRALSDCGSDRPSHFHDFPRLEKVGSALEQAGFETVACAQEIEQDLHADFRQLLQGLKRIGAQNASKQRPPGLFPRRVLQAMAALYRQEYETPAGLPASYSVIYGCGRRNGG